MRRLNDAHYPLVYDPSVMSYWTCDLTTFTTATLADSSGRGNHLRCYAAAGNYWTAQGSHFDDITVASSNAFGAVDSAAVAGWAESGTALTPSFYLSTHSAWSLAFWGGQFSSNTMCFMEFSYTTGFANTDNTYRTWGLYANANGHLVCGWDTPSTPNFLYDTGVILPIGDNAHIGLVCEVNANSTGFRKISTYVNGSLRAYSDTQPGPGTGRGASSTFILGASRVYATNVNSPAFANQLKTLDDVAYWNRTAHDKIREAYRNGVREWNERRLLDSHGCIGLARVLVEDGDGNLINLSAYYGTDFVKDVRISDDVNDQHKKARVRLLRYRGERLNLAPLDEAAVNNINQMGAGSYEPLLEYRRQLKIEVATVPRGVKVEDYHYEPLFDGYIDSLSWGDDDVEVEAIDKMAPLIDQYQIDPKFYAYGEVSSTLAETHLQSLINDNVPRVFVSGTTLTFGYKGGTPAVFTPASSGWVLRYDDSPSGEVATLLQGVADQIGWRIRYRWDQYQQEDRLTFERPNRDKTLGVSLVDRRTLGKFTGTYVKTATPHDFTLEQPLTLSGTVTNNFTNSRVCRVISDREVMVEAYPGALGGSESNVGSLSYGNSYDVAGNLIKKVDDIKKETGAIRNAISVKYKRDVAAVTFPFTRVYHNGAGYPVLVEFSAASPGILESVRKLRSGESSFTISGSSCTYYNGTWTFDYINSTVITGLETLTTAATESLSGTFQSSYINAKEVVGVSTPSIQKYGFRPVGIYEGTAGNIDTDAEALKLSNAVLSDLSEPTEALRINIPFSPWFDLDSSVGLLADVRRRWSTDLNVTVTGFEHNLGKGISYTVLNLRKANPTNGTSWVQRIAVDRDKPSIPGEIQRLPAASILDNISTRGPHQLGGRVQPIYMRGGNRRQPRRLYTELHVGHTPNFVLDDSTCAGISLGGEAFSQYDARGNLLNPKTTYYVRFRERDVFGNPEPIDYTTSATRATVRYNAQGANALVYGCSTTGYFRTGGWSAYPFDKNAAGGDPFNCFHLEAGIVVTAPFCQPGTGAFYRFPADGTAQVEARVGVWNDGYSKPNIPVAFGIMLMGARANSSGSAPLVARFGGPSEATPSWNAATPWLVGTAISTLFVNLNGVVSGYSGDYLQIGIWADTDTAIGSGPNYSGIRTVPEGGSDSWSAVSSSFVKVVFTQD